MSQFMSTLTCKVNPSPWPTAHAHRLAGTSENYRGVHEDLELKTCT